MSLVPALDSLLTPIRQALPPMGLPVAFGLFFLLDFSTKHEEKRPDFGNRDDSDLEELFIQPQAKASCIARHGSYLSRSSSFISLNDDSDWDDEGEFEIDEPIYFEPRKRRHTI